jgi:putative DNA primase/helicase
MQERMTVTKIQIANPRLDQALKYAAAGWHVLPLFESRGGRCACGHPACSRPGKHPRTAQGLHNASDDPAVITQWWTRFPNANIGIATGAPSGIFVLDVDGPDGEKSLRRLIAQNGSLTPTAIVTTGNGRHFYFRTLGRAVASSVGKLGRGLDIRGNGSYVVAHLSSHASGTHYRVVKESLLDGQFWASDAPNWLIQAVTADGPGVPQALDQGVNNKEAEYSARAYAKTALDQELERLRNTPKGERNDTLNRCAFKLGQLVACGLLDASAVTTDLARCARQIGLEEVEIERTITSGLEAGQRHPRQLPALHGSGAEAGPGKGVDTNLSDSLTKELSVLGETDADNAQRFAKRFGDKVIYTPGRGFLAYDGSRWRSDHLLQVMKLAEDTARMIAGEASHLDRESDKAARVKFAKQSLSKGALDRMCDLAKRHVVIEDSRLDSDPWLLNVQNGTIDLRTGQLKEHDPNNYLTKVVPVRFDGEVHCPNFISFLDQALGGDSELIGYMQKAVGYTLTGDTSEQVFFLPHGPGQTGKSTFLHLIREMLGDYGLHTPSDTLLDKKYDNSIPADLARLAGARMVTAVEANWTRQVDEARLKAMTGGDPITARFMRQDFFQFTPEFKLWFAVNDFPGVRGTAGAFWRRVRVIPFEVQVSQEQRDSKLNEKLREEWPGILAWAVQGCLKWRRDGLGVPEAVMRAGGQWQNSADHIRKFSNEEVILDPGNSVQASVLYAHYKAWCERNGEKPVRDVTFKAKLEGLDVTHKRANTGSVWRDVKIRLT